MEANELKIGNKVMFSDDSTIFEVTGIHEFGLDVIDEECGTYIEYDQFEPIPLTEEWLLNFGAKKMDLGFDLKANNFNFSFNSILLCWLNGIKIEIKYVHQLQNLYFALTGTELTLKDVTSSRSF